MARVRNDAMLVTALEVDSLCGSPGRPDAVGGAVERDRGHGDVRLPGEALLGPLSPKSGFMFWKTV